MSKFQLKSVLTQISDEVFKMRDLNKSKIFVEEFLHKKRINDSDEKEIISNINKCKSMYEIHRYLCNSLLKYEGLSVYGHVSKIKDPIFIQQE
jgi:hypothetical protein